MNTNDALRDLPTQSEQSSKTVKTTSLTRRSFLRNTCISITGPTLFLSPALQSLCGVDDLNPPQTHKRRSVKSVKDTFEKKLSFYNTHTGESLKNIVFWAEDYVSEHLHQLNRLFRDHRTNEILPIDKKLWDLLHILHKKLDAQAPFHLISGFRSSQTNAMLCAQSSGVARKSQHTLGKAADISLHKECSLRNLQKAAKELRLGGVGAYSQFVHVDVGRVRYW